MIIYLYGQDSYRRQEKLKSIVAEYQKKHSALTIDHFDLAARSENGREFERLKDFSGGQSLFGETRLGVVHGLEDAEKEFADFLKLAAEKKSITLVIAADEKPKKEFDFLLKKPVQSQEFPPLKTAELTIFIKKEMEKRSIKFSSSHLSSLISIYGGDTWGIVTELDKIALGGKIEAEVLMPQFFSLIQRIKSGTLASRISALAYLLENEEPAAVFNVTASIADPELKVKMADYDVAVKSGKLEYEEVLTDLVLSN